MVGCSSASCPSWEKDVGTCCGLAPLQGGADLDDAMEDAALQALNRSRLNSGLTSLYASAAAPAVAAEAPGSALPDAAPIGRAPPQQPAQPQRSLQAILRPTTADAPAGSGVKASSYAGGSAGGHEQDSSNAQRSLVGYPVPTSGRVSMMSSFIYESAAADRAMRWVNAITLAAGGRGYGSCPCCSTSKWSWHLAAPSTGCHRPAWLPAGHAQP